MSTVKTNTIQPVTTGDNLIIRTGSGDPERIRITTNGDVGIGGNPSIYGQLYMTSSALAPLADLYVENTNSALSGGITLATFIANNAPGDPSDTGAGTRRPRLNIIGTSAGIILGESYNAAANNLMFSIGNQEMMRLNSTGLGVNTTPVTLLHVAGAEETHTNANAAQLLVSNVANTQQIQIAVSGGGTGGYIEGWRPGIGGMTLHFQPSGSPSVFGGDVQALGTVSMSSSFAFRNRIINGGMTIHQRGMKTIDGTTFSAPADAHLEFPVDRWHINFVTDGTFTARQDNDAPPGFSNSILYTVGTADATLAASQNINIMQWIEGDNVVDLALGTSSAKSITVSFWAKSSVTGTYCLTLTNSGTSHVADYCYVREYTIATANTWNYYTLTFPPATAGSWKQGRALGMQVRFCLGSGTDQQTTTGAWRSGNRSATANQTNLQATASATFRLTGVQLESGTQATPFENRLNATEMMLCQRYYETGDWLQSAFGAAGSNTNEIWFSYKTTKRKTPTNANITADFKSVSSGANVAALLLPSDTGWNGYSSNNGFQIKWAPVTGSADAAPSVHGWRANAEIDSTDA